MKILSISFNNLSPFAGSWTIDFSEDEFTQSGAFVFYATSPKYVQALIDTMSLALFGTTMKNGTVVSADDSLFTLTNKDISAATHFVQNDAEYTSEWRCSKGSHKTSWVLKNNKGKTIQEGQKSSIESLLGFGLAQFHRLIKLDPNSFLPFLKGSDEERRSYLTTRLSSDDITRLPALTEAIMKQKKSAVEASRKMVEAYDLKLVPEEKLTADLQKVKDAIAELKAAIQQQESYGSWLQKKDALKDELFKIAKEESELRADIARFDTKRPAMERAQKATALSNDFEQIKNIKLELEDAQKLLGEKKKELAVFNEKVRVSGAALQELDSARRQAESVYGDRRVLLEKVKFIEEKINFLTDQIKEKNAALEKTSTELKLASDIGQKFKSDLTESRNRLGFIQKKLSDLGLNEKIVNEIDSYKDKLDSLSQLENTAQDARKDQRECQKTIEKLKSELQDCDSRMTALKKDELTIQNDIVLKRRSLAKLTGNTDLNGLSEELDSYNEKIATIAELDKSIDQLIKLSDVESREKAQLSKKNNDLKVAAATVHSAVQALRDKITIVSNCEEMLEFQKKILSLEEERKTLENGKPCPLCGSVHHPYSASTPISDSIEGRLEEAKKEQEKATAIHQEAMSKYNEIHTSLKNSEQIINDATTQIDALKSSVLAAASSVDVTGLKEKKVMTWGSLIKQKLSVITNKRDEIASRTAKCDQLNSALKESEEKLNKTYSDIQFLTDLINTKKADLDQTNSLLEKHSWSEAHSNQQQEEVTKELERIYTKYGLKASSPTMLKQQFPFLLGRRNNWVELDAELHELEEHIGQSEQNLEASSLEQRQHKETADNLTAELAKLDTDIKQLNKDKNELLTSQNSDDFETQAERDLTGAKTAYEEALERNKEHQRSSDACQKAVNEAQVKVSELEKQVRQMELNFESALQTAGFTGEAQFKSSLISNAQIKKLQQEDQSLAERLAALQEKKANKKKEFDEQDSLNLTSEPAAKVKENIEKTRAALEENTKLEAQLNDKIEQNNYAKQRYAREFEDLNRKREKQAKWERLYESTSGSGLELFEHTDFDLAYEVLIEQANKQLWLIKPAYTLETDPQNSYELLLRSNKDPSQVKTSQDFDANESYMVSYALALAQRQLNGMDIDLDILFIDGNIARSSKVRKDALLNGFKQLQQQTVLIGIATGNAADKDMFKACISVNEDVDPPTLTGSGVIEK